MVRAARTLLGLLRRTRPPRMYRLEGRFRESAPGIWPPSPKFLARPHMRPRLTPRPIWAPPTRRSFATKSRGKGLIPDGGPKRRFDAMDSLRQDAQRGRR